MKQLLLVLLLFLSGNSVFGQNTEWAPIGAKWNYKYFGFGIEGFTRYYVDKDTVYLGENARKIIGKHEFSSFGEPPQLSDEFTFYTYEMDSVIFLAHNQQYDTLMNLKANIGDTWKLTNQSCVEDRKVTVLDIGYKFIDGCQNKMIVFEYQGFNAHIDTFYSNIGTINHSFYYSDFCAENAIDKPVSINLICYTSENCIYAKVINDCENLSVVSLEGNNSISTYPNPFTNQIFFEYDETLYPNIDVKIYSYNGKILFHSNLNKNKTLSTVDLQSGFYTIIINDTYKQSLIKL